MAAKESGIKTDRYGQVIVDDKCLTELIFQGKSIDNLKVRGSDDIQLFKKYQDDILDTTLNFIEDDDSLSVEEFHQKCADNWLIPESYKSINLREWLLAKCKTDIEKKRVEDELVLFEKRNLYMLLRLFIYLVDYMREHKFVWGVGRGSSVSSYVLFLIGIHRVDSIKYNLQISEFLK